MDNIFFTSLSKSLAPRRFLGSNVTGRRRSQERLRPRRHDDAPAASNAYRPLPSQRYTRLLKLEGFDPETCAIYARLVTVNLDEAPSYTALSYTWGNPFAVGDRGKEDPGLGQYDSVHAWDLIILPEDPVTANPECAEQFVFRDCGPCLANLSVTKSLSDFLCHYYDSIFYPADSDDEEQGRIRRALKMSGTALWVDALCINQDNKAELAQQILLMGDIYAKASQVVVWLGKETPEVDEFCWMVEKVARAFDSVKASQGSLSGAIDFMERHDPLDDNFWTQHCGLAPRGPSDSWLSHWFHYFLFYTRRRWFRRAWIIQEICLAKQAVVMCGTKFLQWRLLTEVDVLLDMYAWRSKFSAVLIPAVARHGVDLSVATIAQFHMLGHAIGNAQQDESSSVQGWERFWYNAVEVLRNQSSTKPEDFVYCTLGMARMCFPDVVDSLFGNIDLSRSPAETYTWLASNVLKHSTGLDLLGQISIKLDRTTPGLPSWVPDLADEASIPSSYPGLVAAWSKPGVAGNSAADHPPFFVVGRELFIRGTRIAKIQKPSLHYTFENERWIKSLLSILLLLPGDYQLTAQPAMEAGWRTMIMDCHGPNDKICPADPSMADCFRAWSTLTVAGLYGKAFPEDAAQSSPTMSFDEITAFWRTYPSEAPEPFPSRQVILQQVRRVMQGDAADDIFAKHIQFETRLRDTMRKRVLFATAEGYLGLGSDICMTGDEVWAVVGARVPLILRPVEDGKFEFLGEAYIHGMMGHGLGGNMSKIWMQQLCVR